MPVWTDDQREEVVRRVERHARRHPRDFRARVIYFVLIGYAYILAVFLVMLMLGANAWLRLTASVSAQSVVLGVGLLFVLLGVVAVVHVLWIRTLRPEGEPISPADAPALFALLRRLSTAIRGPRIHRVLLTTEFAAGIAQWPRLGWLGWHENTLMLGLPLLCAVTPGELEAVLAHELGHLAGRHGRLAAWIGRGARTWDRVMSKLEERRYLAGGVFTRFLRWYQPWFEVYVTVLSRMQERVADAAAASVGGANGLARALVNLRLREALLRHRVWPAIDDARTSREPSVAPFRRFMEALRAALPEDVATSWLEDALAERTPLDATHPALAERLGMLGVDVAAARALVYMDALPATAAECVLGPALTVFADRFDARWRASVADDWRDRYEKAEAMRTELAALEHDGALTADRAYRRAELVDELQGADAAMPLLRSVLTTAPEHHSATLHLGRLLVERNEAEGVSLLERAVTQDPRAGVTAYPALERFARRSRDMGGTRRYESLAAQAVLRLERDEAERRELYERESFATATLSAEQIARLREALARHDDVREAYLVRKELTVYPERPLHVVAVRGDRGNGQRVAESLDEALDAFPCARDRLPKDLQTRLLAIAGEPFYRAAAAR